MVEYGAGLTNPFVHQVAVLSELDSMNVAPGTILSQHLAVHQPHQVLPHLALQCSNHGNIPALSPTRRQKKDKLTTEVSREAIRSLR